MAIVEPEHRLQAHRHDTAEATYDANDVDLILGAWQRHEVGNDNRTCVRLELGVEDQRTVAVATRYRPDFGGRCDAPVPVLRSAKECRKASAAVEARRAEPVDRAVPANQRGR